MKLPGSFAEYSKHDLILTKKIKKIIGFDFLGSSVVTHNLKREKECSTVKKKYFLLTEEGTGEFKPASGIFFVQISQTNPTGIYSIVNC